MSVIEHFTFLLVVGHTLAYVNFSGQSNSFAAKIILGVAL
jgi:hypothetical protein